MTTTTTTTTFRTMQARFAGSCRRCGKAITPGETIRYGGKGLTYHIAAACSDTTAPAAAAAQPQATLNASDLPGQLQGEGWSEYGRRAMLHALQAETFSGLDNDGLAAAADACNHAMSAKAVSDTTVACLAGLQRELRSRLAGRQADTALRLARLQAQADLLQADVPIAPQADAPSVTPDAPQGPQGGGGSKVRKPKGPQRPTPPSFALPQLDSAAMF